MKCATWDREREAERERKREWRARVDSTEAVEVLVWFRVCVRVRVIASVGARRLIVSGNHGARPLECSRRVVRLLGKRWVQHPRVPVADEVGERESARARERERERSSRVVRRCLSDSSKTFKSEAI